ncbi:MAG: hypothetical protein Q9187_002431 [Circinaria calcarea]
MAECLQIPTVTEVGHYDDRKLHPTIRTESTPSQEDLLAFHAWRYGRLYSPRPPALDDHGNLAHAEDTTEDDDGLGWYPDGVKRTLTDEQIAMFRHSEIQAILRAERHRREMKSSDSEATSDGEPDINVFDGEPSMLGPFIVDSDQHEPLEDIEDGEIDEEDDEEEYARFIEKEREEFESAALLMKARKGRETLRITGRTTSTRRRVRELDEIAGGNDVLDYGDGPTVSPIPAKAGAADLNPSGGSGTISTFQGHQVDEPNYTNSHNQIGATIGRKIWWPTIRS